MPSSPPLLGVFVGGASRRMGGAPKGLLTSPEPGATETLVERLARVGAEAGLEVCLVGEASAYAGVLPGVPRLPDEPPGIGPLSGLAALLAHAGARPALTVGCDMPFVDAAVLRKLVSFPSVAPVVAPRRGEAAPYEPMLARWAPPRVLPALTSAIGRGVRSFQGLLAGLEVDPLPVDEAVARALVDWDTPDDLLIDR